MNVLSRVLPALVAALLALAAATAAAQAYPARPIQMIVTFGTGGGPDTLARTIAQKINPDWGQPVVVVNKPGAGGNIGAEFTARAPADGYTLVLGTVGTHSINGAVYEKMPYDMVRDFTPVTLLATTPLLLVVNNEVPAKDLRQLIALAKAHPSKLTFASQGVGTSVHVSGELLNTMAGVKTIHVPYKGRQFSLPDLLSGSITMMFDPMPSALPLVKEGKLRAIGVTTAARSSFAPEIPTLAEQGLAGFEATSWFAVFAPANTPRPIVERLHAEFVRIFSLPDVREKLAALGLEPLLQGPEELARYQQAEIAKWARVVRESGAKAN